MLIDLTPPAEGNKKKSSKDSAKEPIPLKLPHNELDKENVPPNLPHEENTKPAPPTEACSPTIEEALPGTAERKPEVALVPHSDDVEAPRLLEAPVDTEQLRKRREEIERLQSEKRDLEEELEFANQRLRKREGQIKSHCADKERLNAKVNNLTATITALKDRIGDLERDLAQALEEKAVEEEKTRHLVKLHAEQAQRHAETLAEEQKLHEKEVAEERERARLLGAQLQESQQANAALSLEIEATHTEMQKVKESQQATQQLATLTAIKDAFALQIQVQKKENESLVSQVDLLQRELFFALALALKFNYSLVGMPCNRDVNALWEQATKLDIKQEQFSRWLSIQFAQVKQSEH